VPRAVNSYRKILTYARTTQTQTGLRVKAYLDPFNGRFGFSLQTAVLNHSAAEGWAESGLPIGSAQSVLLPSRLASTPLKMVKDCPPERASCSLMSKTEV
jgi:hypothetical protein